MHYVGSMQQGGIMRRYFDYFGIGDSLEIRPLDEAFDIVSPAEPESSPTCTATTNSGDT